MILPQKFIYFVRILWFVLSKAREEYSPKYIKVKTNVLVKRTYLSNEIAACHCSSQYRLRSFQDSQICVIARSFLKCTSVWAKSMAYSLQFNRSDLGLKLQTSAFKLFTVAKLRHQLRL